MTYKEIFLAIYMYMYLMKRSLLKKNIMLQKEGFVICLYLWGVVTRWLVRRLSLEGSWVLIPLYIRHVRTFASPSLMVACGASA